jgi:hypothetical protein
MMGNLVNSNDRTKPKLRSLTMYYVPRLIDFRIQPKKLVGSFLALFRNP